MIARALLAAASLLLGCADRLDLEDRPCPCLDDAGYVCCASTQRCLRRGDSCPGGSGADARPPVDAPADLTSPADLPIADVSVTPDAPPEAPAVVCQCPQHPPESCGFTGACDERGACLRHPAGTVCKLASCESATHFVPESRCDGRGVCEIPVPIHCAPTVCHDARCLASCRFDQDCQAPAVCLSGSCRRRPEGCAASAPTDAGCPADAGGG